MKRFFYASAAVLMLAIAFHFGFTTASAQAPGNPVVAVGTMANYAGVVFTANGDVYYSPSGDIHGPFVHATNVFSGGPTPALQESWGQLKSRYRANPPAAPGMAAKPGASDR